MPLKCMLVELGANHCRGTVPFAALDPETIVAWQQKLVPNYRLRLRMELLRGVPGFEVEGVVLRADPVNDGVEIELSFVRSDSARRSGFAPAVTVTNIHDDDEPRTLQPIEQPEPRKHKTSIIETLKPLAPDDSALIERVPAANAEHDSHSPQKSSAERPQSAGVPTQSGIRRRLDPDEMVQMERPKDLQSAYLALHRPAGSAAVDAGSAPPAAAISLQPDPREATVQMDRAALLASGLYARPPQSPHAPPAPPDETVMLERPRDLRIRPPRAQQTPQGENKSADAKTAANPDASVVMQRPPEIKIAASAPLDATVAAERPTGLRAPALDATVAVERPAALKSAPALDETIPANRAAAPAMDATAVSERPNAAPPLDATVVSDRPAVSPPDATVEMSRGAGFAEPSKRERRGSGIFQPDPPKSESGAIKTKHAFSKKLGEVLVQMGKLTMDQADEVAKIAIESGERMGRLLIAWEMVPPDVLCRALSLQSGLPMTLLDEDSFPEKLRRIFPLPLMMRHNFVPFDESAAVLCVAACNPLEADLVKELERISRKVVEVFLAREDQVARQLDWLRVKMKTRSRRGLRFRLKLPVSFQFCSRMGVRSEKDVFDATTINISEGGFLIESPPVPGDPGEMLLKGLHLNLCLKPMSGEIWSICDVREIRLVQEQPPRWLMGLEIVDINEESRARLKELCKSAKTSKMPKS